MEKRDLLITDDVGMLTMCRRLRDEHDIELEAMGLKEYLDRRRDPRSCGQRGLTGYSL